MLDVTGTDDVNAGVKQGQDILVPLLVLTSGHVGVGKFIDDCDLGPPREHRVQIHFLDHHPSVLEPAPRNNLQSFDQCRGFGAAVGLDERQNNVNAALHKGVGFF